MSAAGGVLAVMDRYGFKCGDPESDCSKAIATVEAMAGALRAYRRAGFGNSTDFYAQAEAARLADAALSRYHGSAAPAGDGAAPNEKDKVVTLSEWLRNERPEAERALWAGDLVRIVRLIERHTLPAAPAGGGDELPEPFCTEDVTELAGTKIVGTRDLYTAEQMREYGERCRRLASAGSASCAECGAALEEVRPGKHQHPTCSQHPSAGSAPAPSAVSDWKAVPVEPTPKMVKVGTLMGMLTPNQACAAFQSMLAAAPTPETQP